MQILDYLKYGALLLVISTIIGSGVYIRHLQSTVDTLTTNNEKLEGAIEQQKLVVKRKIREIKEIKDVNDNLTVERQSLQKDVDKLSNVFRMNSRGKSRDFGDIARAKPGLVNRIINKATKNVNRCFEIATGSPVLKGERNNECSNLINSHQ